MHIIIWMHQHIKLAAFSVADIKGLDDDEAFALAC